MQEQDADNTYVAPTGTRARIVYVRDASYHVPSKEEGQEEQQGQQEQQTLDEIYGVNEMYSIFNSFLKTKKGQEAIQYVKYNNKSPSALMVLFNPQHAEAICAEKYIGRDLRVMEPYPYYPCPDGLDPCTLAIFGWTRTLREFKTDCGDLLRLFADPVAIRDKDFQDSQGGLKKIILVTYPDFDTASGTKLMLHGDNGLRVDFAKKFVPKEPKVEQQKSGPKGSVSSVGRNIVDTTRCENKKCDQPPTHGTVVAKTTRWCAKHAPKANYIVNLKL